MKRALLFLPLLVFAACSGGASVATRQLPVVSSTTTATLKITVPAPPTTTAARSPQYVSYRTQSVAINGSGVNTSASEIIANVTPGSTGCTSTAPVTCTIPFAANIGYAESFTVTAYDAPNGTGNVLSTATVTQAIRNGSANTVSVTLDPLVTFTGAINFSEALTVGPDGNAWFTEDDFANAAIGSVTPSGVITTYTDGGTLSQLRDITTGPDGNLWFIGGSGGNVGKVVKSDTNGNMTMYGGSLKFPIGIAVGPDNNLWVSENGYAGNGENGAVAKVTTSGVITEYAVPNTHPVAIAPGPDGNLWYTDLDDKGIGKVTTSGVITLYGSGSVNGAYGIVGGPDGNVWFTETGAIGRVTPTGSISTYGAGIVNAPSAITLGPDGNLWFIDQGTSSVGTVNPTTGVVVEYGGLGATGFTYGAAFDTSGNLWIAAGNAVEEFIR